MSRRQMMRLIILPQAIRVVVPPLGNYFISLFKDTSLVSIVTVKELMFTGQIIAATNFQYFTIFTIIGIIYLSLSYPASLFVQLSRAADEGRLSAQAHSPPQAGRVESRRMIRLEKICKSFGHLHVLKDVDLEVQKGEVVCVIGPSGPGNRPCSAASIISRH